MFKFTFNFLKNQKIEFIPRPPTMLNPRLFLRDPLLNVTWWTTDELMERDRRSCLAPVGEVGEAG